MLKSLSARLIFKGTSILSFFKHEVLCSYGQQHIFYMHMFSIFFFLNSSGRCQHCSQALTKIKITQKEYENLKVALISDSLIGGDIFKKTNPKELKNFLSFIRRTSPYDIVVDGLNVMYLVKPDGPRHFKSRSVKSLVLHQSNLKITVAYLLPLIVGIPV